MNCSSEDKYVSKAGKCCDRCPAGKYMDTDCDDTKPTKCVECGHGSYTATINHSTKCYRCTTCLSSNKQEIEKVCTGQQNTVCGCLTGFYCNSDLCEHCLPVANCPEGQGVKVQATRTNDTVCAPCKAGTFSNVTDSQSACKTHISCDDYGKWQKTPGTLTTDAICGELKTQCPWMLPAGLWSGLVLTALVLFGVICWREKRKSYRTVNAAGPVSLIDMVPAPPNSPLHLPLPSTKLNGHCQESCIVDGCSLPIYTPDEKIISDCIQDSMDSCAPITPLKVSFSFAESSLENGHARYGPVNFLRTHSEPQEDEYCGT